MCATGPASAARNWSACSPRQDAACAERRQAAARLEQALASYKARKGSGAPNIELASAGGGGGKKSGGFLSAFFGGGDDEADDSADVETASAAPAPKPRNLKPTATAKSSNLPGIAIVAPENAQRANIPQIAEEQAPEPEKDTPETIIAALPAKEIPLPDFAPRPMALTKPAPFRSRFLATGPT